MATWASRIPQVRDRLHLNPSQLGFLLLAIAVGSLISLPLSGPLVARIGSRRVVSAMSTLFGVGMATAGIGYRIGVVPVVIGLAMMGFAAGAWDVGMNVHGAFVEQRIGRSVMSRFHAGFSLGTVVGALIGAAMVATKVSVTIHLALLGGAVAIIVGWATRRFLADHHLPPTLPSAPRQGVPTTNATAPERGHFASWRERRTLLIGVFVLAFAFAEGVGNDWIAVAVIDGHHSSAALGTVVFALFLSAMTMGRWFGPALLDNYGRTMVVRTVAVLGVAGVSVFVLAPVRWVAFGGAVLWGLGASLGFPVGMSAAADEPAFAAGRVSVVASIGYCAFLVGPPLIGFLGHQFSVLSALLAVAALLTLAALLSPVVQAPPAVPSEAMVNR